ncbi:MAG: dihydrodipicolinate synthase family protein [Phycisphaerae bacterium]|nr:dihydrodipicolinate synthase family protein [Phycisphaerae bacterium]
MNNDIINRLQAGCVIPAHPLALETNGRIDVPRQRALTHYYLAAGAGGLAVGVHTTQFAIHDPKLGLLKPVLQLAAETAREHVEKTHQRRPIMIAGILGQTTQAVKEARLARETGYHVGLLSLTALAGRPIEELIDHARSVAEVIPLMGFYLQQCISGMALPQAFWRRFVEIENVVAIKIAPFSRYHTLDVLEAVAASGRAGEISLYTGNDDNIVLDLLTNYRFTLDGKTVNLRMAGGLLGQWACWTRKAVEILERVQHIRESGEPVPPELLTLAGQLTLANKAIFDADHSFAGCIPGILYVLKRQGILKNVHTLDPHEQLSPGQAEKIDRIILDHPHLTDDDFVRQNLSAWLSP